MERLALIVSLIVNVITILGFVTGTFHKLWRWLKSHRTPSDGSFQIPTKTLRILPEPRPNALTWHMGSRGTSPVMQIVGDFLVTNVSRFNVLVPVARLRKPRTLGVATVTGENAIAPGESADLRFLIWVEPPVKQKGEIFRADVALVDQFGNEHWFKNLEFQYR